MAVVVVWQDRHVVSSGYVYARDVDGILGKPGAIRPEHRLVMAQKLGRPLETWEQVYHIDKDRANNDPANLLLVTAKEHAQYHTGKKGPHKQREPLPEFEGRTPWLKMRCPYCGKVFFKRKAASVLNRPNRLNVNCCSNSCATRLADAVESGAIADMQELRRGNVICEFRTNAKFMSEYLSRRHRFWTIDDLGVFHS